MAVLPVGIGSEEAAAGGYQIERSLRFNSADTARLTRTLSSSNQKKWTWSAWIKRSALTDCDLFTAKLTGNTYPNTSISFDQSAENVLRIWSYTGSSFRCNKYTTQVFRDVGSWYHLIVAIDTNDATAEDRVKLYVNGTRVTSWGTNTNPSSGDDLYINGNSNHAIGGQAAGGYGNFNGYMAEINFVDGQALTPTDFGEFNEDTGVWQPKAYTGSYGTNGFYLDFADNSGVTSTTLGKDSSGNSNNWTPNNFSVTAGAGNDSLVDSPTRYGEDTGAGGEVRGNYCTLNPLAIKVSSGTITVANGNLDASDAATTYGYIPATMAVSSGKWYWEVFVTSQSNSTCEIGIKKNTAASMNNSNGVAGTADGYSYVSSGSKRNNTSTSAYGNSWTTNDVIGVALDLDAGEIKFYKNGTVQNSGTAAFTGLSGEYFPAFGDYANVGQFNYACNFGQRPFSYAAPSGFKALCTTNLPEPTIADGSQYFNPVLYTGNGSTQSITGVGFQPDFVWVKARSVAYYHRLYDAVRGFTKELYSNATDAESTETNTITAVSSDGFSLGDAIGVNGNTQTFVAWNWKANGSGVSNTAGSISSTVSANTDAGFSIVTYTGTGSAGTVGHGLGAIPGMIITKNRSSGSTDWTVWHQSYNGFASSTGYLYLNKTDAGGTTQVFYNGLAMTSTSYGIDVNSGGSTYINQSGQNYLAYCFAPVAGYSAFGSYTGNGSTDGTFVYTGFKPRFVLIKRSSAGTSFWYILDSARSTYNEMADELCPDLSNAENTVDGTTKLDFVSNGFKLRTTGGEINVSGSTYIYAAFAENPFAYSLAR